MLLRSGDPRILFTFFVFDFLAFVLLDFYNFCSFVDRPGRIGKREIFFDWIWSEMESLHSSYVLHNIQDRIFLGEARNGVDMQENN